MSDPFAHERAQRKARADEFRATITAVAAALGATYAHREDPEGFHWTASGDLHVPGDPVVNLYASLDRKGSGPTRIAVSVSLPRDANGGYIRFADCVRTMPDGRKATDAVLSITCAIDKAPERIAADIKRRLLPDATFATQTVLDMIATRAAYSNSTEETARRIAAAAGATLEDPEQWKRSRDDWRVRIKIGGDSLDLRAYGPGRIEIERSYVSEETALAIVRALRGA